MSSRCGGYWNIGHDTGFAFAGEGAALVLGRQPQELRTAWTRFRLQRVLSRHNAIMGEADASLGFAAAAAASAAAVPGDQLTRHCVHCDKACAITRTARVKHLRPMMMRCPELGPAVTSSVWRVTCGV